MTERRYREEEVRKVFGIATTESVAETPAETPPKASPTTAVGLTLAEMQSIGLEVGLDPDAVARAASSLEVGDTRAWQKSMGMPIEVGVTTPLPRAITDHEWELLVAELRATFHAKGKIATYGGLREWSNGNLHACVEPTETGYRLRMTTLKSSARGMNALGVTGIVTSVVVYGSLLASGAAPGALVDALMAPVIFGVAGLGVLANNWFTLPGWAQRRKEQMNHIATKLRAITAKPPAE